MASYRVEQIHVNHLPNSLTWLKRKLKELGLHRRGPHARYSPLALVKAAIKVMMCSAHAVVAYLLYAYIGRNDVGKL